MSVVVDKHFFSSLPALPETNLEEADIAWLIYELVLDPIRNRYDLTHSRVVYTAFTPALETITTAEAGSIHDFIQTLQHKLDEKLEDGSPPDAPTLADIFKE